MFSGCQACSYVDHWLLGSTAFISTSAHPPVALRAIGPSPTPPRVRRIGCSLLCFEEAAISAPHDGRAGVSTLAVEPAPLVCRSSRDRHVPQPRSLHGSGVTLENCIASTSVLKVWLLALLPPEEESRSVRFQVTKSQRWMPWRQVPMKDVGGCDKPRGAADQASIRGYPNEETHRCSDSGTPV